MMNSEHLFSQTQNAHLSRSHSIFADTETAVTQIR
jgi:hypothetical protein